MDLISNLLDLFLHLDEHLSVVIQTYGTWTYLILFLIIFLETGIVITPFLPGDSLLFAAGTFAGMGALNIYVLLILLSVAAILGDTVNYWIGHYIGPKAFSGEIRFLKKEYLDRTHEFYERHGGKTIILARFIPIIRTFAPFVAGIGKMRYRRFAVFNITGGVAWVTIFSLGGYWFGNLAPIKRNFHYVILAIIIISVMPAVIEVFRERQRARREGAPDTSSIPRLARSVRGRYRYFAL